MARRARAPSAISGVPVPDGVVEAYEAVLDQVDLASIAARERVTRHDVKARIEEFAALAGHEHIHKAMTSRDLTENVEQLQIRAVAASWSATGWWRRWPGWPPGRWSSTTWSWSGGRTTCRPRRPRSASGSPRAAEELLIAYDRIADLHRALPAARDQGAGRHRAGPARPARRRRPRWPSWSAASPAHLGFARVLTSVGQVYPRSLDFDVVSALVQAAAGPSSLATTIRLMAGQELVTEGFQPGQVGSSAMPHKMNTRSCERVNGLAVVLRGYLSMVGELAGDQWNEGDVSCSVVRRVALPDAFFAADGLFQTLLTVLDEFGAYPAVIARELDRYLPFLATTKILVAAIRRGRGPGDRARGDQGARGRGGAGHAREGRGHNDLFDRLAADARLRPDPGRDRRAGGRPVGLRRRGSAQVHAVVDRIAAVVALHPDAAAAYEPAADPVRTPVEWLTAALSAFVLHRAGRAAGQDVRRHAGARHPLPAAAGVAGVARPSASSARRGGRRTTAHAAARAPVRLAAARSSRSGRCCSSGAPARPTRRRPSRSGEYAAEVGDARTGWRAFGASFVVLFRPNGATCPSC